MPSAEGRRVGRRVGLLAAAVAVVGAGLHAAGPGAGQGPQLTGTAALSGVVIDAVTKQPVPGAVVSLRRAASGGGILNQPRMVTDRKGRFVFLGLLAGDNYFLDATHASYAHTRYGWAAPNGPLTVRDMALIAVADGQWVGSITIPLWRLATIEGRVLDERGEPVVGVAVRGFSMRSIAGRQQLVGGPIVSTDDRGLYRMIDLEPGRYVLGVLSVQHTVLDTTRDAPQARPVGELASGGIGAGRGASVTSPTVDVDGRHRLALTNFATPPPPAASDPRAYGAVFYPGARTIGAAAPLEIGYGDARTGIDFQLQLEPTVRVEGRVESPTGVIPPFLLRLMPAGSEQLGFGSEAATTVIEPDGRFVFLNVPEGSYTILAQASVMDFTSGSSFNRFDDAPGFPGGGISVGSLDGAPGLGYLTRSGQPAGVWGRAPISVGRQDITDFVLPLRRTVTVRGRVVLEEGSSTPTGGRFIVTAQPADGDPSRGQPSGWTDPKDPAHEFAIQGLMAGRYVLRTGRPIVSIRWDGRDITETGIDVSAAQDFEDVRIIVTDRDASLGGTVAGIPGPTAAVMIFPVERERWVDYGWESARIRTARTTSKGAYNIAQLPRGDYFVVAVDVARIDAWTDPAYLAAAALRATRVSLEWGEKETVDLTYQEVVVR